MFVRLLKFIVLCLYMLPVMAQGTDHVIDNVVLSRARPELDPRGISMGMIRIYPSVAISERSIDNIYASAEIPVEDSLVLVQPGIGMESDWRRIQATLNLTGRYGRYRRTKSEDFNDHEIRGDVKFNLGRNFIDVYILSSEAQERRTVVENEAGVDPTRFRTANLELFYRISSRRFPVRIGIFQQSYDFSDSGEGISHINNDDRDSIERGVLLFTGYKKNPSDGLFLNGRFHEQEFTDERDDLGYRRSYHGGAVSIGYTRGVANRIFSSSLFLGWVSIRYDDARFQPLSDYSARLKLGWNPSGLTFVTFSWDRKLEATTYENAYSLGSNMVTLAMDHELLRNLILHADFSGAEQVYLGNGRLDRVFGTGIAVKYMMSRRLYVTAEYLYEHREAEQYPGSVALYNLRIYSIQLRFQL